MPDIKFTFTGEERGLIADALRSAGAIEASSKAARGATAEFTRQEAAIAKLSAKLRQLNREQDDLSKKLNLGRAKGLDDKAIERMTAAMDRLKHRSAGVQEALAFEKLDAGARTLDQVSRRTDIAAAAFSRLGSIVKSAAGAFAVGGLFSRGVAAGSAGLQQAGQASAGYIASQAAVSQFAAAGSPDVQAQINAIRAKTGQTPEQAARTYAMLRQGGEIGPSGIALAQQLTGTTEDPTALLEAAAKLKTGGAGFSSMRQAINAVMAASSSAGVVASPLEVAHNLQAVISESQGVGATAQESTAMMAQALHLGKDPQAAAAIMRSMAGAMASRNLLGKGWQGGMEALARQMPKGFFEGNAAALRSQVGGSGPFASLGEAQNFIRLMEMSGQREQIQAAVASAFAGSGPGDYVSRMSGARSPVAAEAMATSRVLAEQERLQAEVYGPQASRKERMLAALGAASGQVGEWEGMSSLRQGLAGGAYSIARFLGASEKSALNLGFDAGSFLSSGDRNSRLQIEPRARTLYESSLGDTPAGVQMNTQATEHLTQAIQELTGVLKGTDLRYPSPRASSAYQALQPNLANR